MRRSVVACLTALALGSAGLALAVPPAAADTSDTRVDLPDTISAPSIVAASGDAVVLDVSTGTTPNLVLTRDGGKTFDALDAPWAADGIVAGAWDGTLVAYTTGTDDDGDYTDVYLTDLASGETADPVRVPGVSLQAVDATTAVYADSDGGYHAENLSTAETTDLAYSAPTSGDPTVEVSLAGQDVALFSAFTTTSDDRPGTGSLDVVPLDGSAATLTRVPVPALMDATLRSGEVVYASATSKALSACFRSLSDWDGTPNCATTTVPGKGDQRDAWTEVHASDAWVEWSASSDSGTVNYLVDDSTTPATLTAIKTSDSTTLYPVGDAQDVLATVGSGKDGYVGSVGANGTIGRLFGYPTTKASVQELELTPDRVTGLDDRPAVGVEDFQAWQRSLTASGIGDEERPFPRAVDVGTSGARTLLDDGSKLQLYDRGQLVRSLAKSKYGSLPGLISGPYYPAYTLAYVQAMRVDGKALASATIRGMFGSLVLERTNASLGRYDVVDLVSGASVRVDVPLKYRVQGFTLGGLWGDWVYGYTFDSDNVPYTLAINYRTSQSYARYGLPVDYGDSFVALQYYDDDGALRLEVWNPATEATESIPDVDWNTVVTDGTGRLAYTTGSQLVVRDLTVAPASPPRLLGVLAPDSLNLITSTRSWQPEFDTTKALADGTLTIQNSAGTVVRTIPVGATADGSIRDVSWNGQSDAGKDVPTGTYTWRLVAPAADGSGNLVRVDGGSDFGAAASGTNGISGKITVIKQYLGSVSGSTPTISGTAKVAQTLTAKVGTWSPSAVKPACQWRRTTSKGVTTDIADATKCTYKVQPADVGMKLSVSVSGTLDGWKPATKTSKLTSAVAKASFTQTLTPTISDPTPTVGDSLTASAGTWEPVPVGFTYQWYKVKGSTSTSVSSATSSPTYLVKSSDAGYQLKVKVTGTKDGYNSVSKYSKVTKAVAKA